MNSNEYQQPVQILIHSLKNLWGYINLFNNPVFISNIKKQIVRLMSTKHFSRCNKSMMNDMNE